MSNPQEIRKSSIQDSYIDTSIKKTETVLDKVEKGEPLSNIFVPTDEVEMLRKGHKSGLVKKQVTVTAKNGTTHKATRWVKPDTGESHDLHVKHKKYSQHAHQHGDGKHGTAEERIQEIINSDIKPIDKVRKLATEGIYDQKTLARLSAYKYDMNIPDMLRNEVDINVHEYTHPNEALPAHTPPDDSVSLQDDEGQRMAISDIQTLHGNKEAQKAQKALKDELIAKYGITVEDKWNSYEQNIDMLLDGDLGLRSVMGYGVGGIGKTYTFDKQAKERKMIEYDPELDMNKGSEEYDYVKIGGKIGSREMQRYMYEHRNKLLVFDDCDSMWNDEGLINVLKNTLDTSGDGRTQWAQRLPERSKGSGDEVPATFKFGGSMIFITNLTKAEFASRGATPITESRAASTDLTMNMEQTLERLETILPFVTLKDANREEMSDIEDTDKTEALNALKEVAPYANINQLNTRVLTGLIAKARYQRKHDGKYNAVDLIKQAIQQFGIV